MEEIILQGEWIHFIAHQEGEGFVKNLLFENVNVLHANKVWALFKGSHLGSINGSPIANTDSASIHFNRDSIRSC